MSRYLLDANILVYSIASDRKKRMRALEVVERVAREPTGALPAQALAEFSSVALRKLVPPLPPQDVYEQVQLYERVFPIVPLTAGIVLEAIRGVQAHMLAYYDAQIWAAAKLNQIAIVLSEDFSSYRVIEGVTFLDPLESSFDLRQLADQ